MMENFNPFYKPKQARKTAEQEQFELITDLIRDKSFQEPTITYLSKTKEIKLPIVCDKCPDLSVNLDEMSETDEKILNYNSDTDDNQETKWSRVRKSSLTLLKSPDNLINDQKLCLLYHKHKETLDKNRSISNIEYTNTQRPNIFKNPPQSAPRNTVVKQNEKDKAKVGFIVPTNHEQNKKSLWLKTGKKNANEKMHEVPMVEGDIRYTYNHNGLEIKRLSSKNWMTIDIFKSDVCRDQNEKSSAEWLNRQKEDENRMKQKFPSKIYEKQLQEAFKNYKKGALTYEQWARQSYHIKILKEKIRQARRSELAALEEQERKLKEQKSRNSYELWKINKEFARMRVS